MGISGLDFIRKDSQHNRYVFLFTAEDECEMPDSLDTDHLARPGQSITITDIGSCCLHCTAPNVSQYLDNKTIIAEK